MLGVPVAGGAFLRGGVSLVVRGVGHMGLAEHTRHPSGEGHPATAFLKLELLATICRQCLNL